MNDMDLNLARGECMRDIDKQSNTRKVVIVGAGDGGDQS